MELYLHCLGPGCARSPLLSAPAQQGKAEVRSWANRTPGRLKWCGKILETFIISGEGEKIGVRVEEEEW